MTVILLGPKKCPNCAEVATKLEEEGIPSSKLLIDPEQHGHLIDAAKVQNFLEAPIICLENESGNLEYVAAGTSPFALISTKRKWQLRVAA